MIRKRQRRVKRPHYALLANRAASGYQARAVSKLISAIRSQGGAYTLYEPETATDLLRQAEVAGGLRRATAALPQANARAGKVTALIACGGDGTLNLVARAALKADLPVAHFPLGRLNNFAATFYGTTDPDKAMKSILSSAVRSTDVATAGGLPFFGSVGLGFTAYLVEELQERALPRFGVGWSQLGARVAARVEPKRTILKVDSFRFELQPRLLNVNLLTHSAGLPISPASIPDDGRAEVLFDVAPAAGDFSTFIRLISSRKYLYGDEIRLYRGRVISVQAVKDRRLCLDGEMIQLPTDTLEIKIEDKKLQVLC